MEKPNFSISILGMALATTGACVGHSAADAGTDRGTPLDPRAAICAAPDAAVVPVTYVQIQQIFDDNCVSCHGDGTPLDLMAGRSWRNLLNQTAPDPDSCGGILVAPGNLDASYLYLKLSSAAPCYGRQMPLGEFFPDPLPACVVTIVQRWIAAGAVGPLIDGGDAGGRSDAGTDGVGD